MSNIVLEDFIGGSKGLNLAQLAIAQGNVDIFYISERDEQTGEVLGYLIGSTFDDFKGMKTFSEILASSTAMNAVVNSSTAMDIIVNSSTAIAAMASSDIALKSICSNEITTTAIATSIQAHRDIIINTLDNSSLFAKSTTTFSQNNVVTKTELADTNTIIIPLQFEDSYLVGNYSSVSTRSLWYSKTTDYRIFASAEQDVDNVIAVTSDRNTLGNSVVSMRGITHNQSINGDSFYSKPTCDIYTVI